jgi:hypothetical protein
MASTAQKNVNPVITIPNSVRGEVGDRFKVLLGNPETGLSSNLDIMGIGDWGLLRFLE